MDIIKTANLLMEGLGHGSEEFRNTLIDVLFDTDRLVTTKEVKLSSEHGHPTIKIQLEVY